MRQWGRILLLCIFVCWSSAVVEAQQIQLDILTVNDFHGALAPEERRPGAAVLMAAIEQERAANPQGTLLLAAGDMLQGSVDSNLLYGRPVVEMMNAMQVDAMALGNHEFDWGLRVLQERAKEAQFPFLCGNVVDKQTAMPLEFVKPYVILERQGVKIAVIGAVTQETLYKSHPNAVYGLEIQDPAVRLNAWAQEARKHGASIVIALTHLSSYIDKNGKITGEAADVAEKLAGVNVLVSAHSHERVAGFVKGIAVLQAEAYGRGLGKVHLSYDSKMKTVQMLSASVTDLVTHPVPPEPRMQELVRRQEEPILALKEQAVGSSLYPLGHSRNTFSPLGQWVADAMRSSVQADVAFLNGGGVRLGLPAGEISLGQVYAALPFDNTLYTVQLSGKQIRKILEHGLFNPTFGMLQFSGLKVVCDPEMPEGARVKEVRLASGDELADGKHYLVVANDFMAAGGDGYTMLREGLEGRDTYIVLRDIVLREMKRQQPIDFTGDERLLERKGDSLRLPDAA